MPKWTLKTAGDEVALFYTDAKNNIDFECGRCTPDTPVREIRNFVLKHADPFDVINIGEGRQFAYLPAHTTPA